MTIELVKPLKKIACMKKGKFVIVIHHPVTFFKND